MPFILTLLMEQFLLFCSEEFADYTYFEEQKNITDEEAVLVVLKHHNVSNIEHVCNELRGI